MQKTITDNYDDRIIKETMLDLRTLMPIRRVSASTDIKDAVERGVYRVRPGTVVKLLHYLQPQEKWSLLIRGKAYSYDTEDECLAFLDGKYGNVPKSLMPYLYDLQLFCDRAFDLQFHCNALPRDEKYYAHPVVQHLKTGEGYGIHPWCIQYRGSGKYFKTFAEACAYVEGKWGRYLGDESVYA